MTYLELINQFWKAYWNAPGRFADEEVVMYMYMLHYFDQRGWRERALQIRTVEFESQLGWNRHKIMRVRDQLERHGLIDVCKGQGRGAPMYAIRALRSIDYIGGTQVYIGDHRMGAESSTDDVLCVKNDTQVQNLETLCVEKCTQKYTQNPLCVENDTKENLCVEKCTQKYTQKCTQKEVSPTPLSRISTTTGKSACIREEGWWKTLEKLNPGWAPTYGELKSMADQLFLSQEQADYFWEWYSELGWLDKNDRPMRCWQATLARWKSEGFKPLAEEREQERKELHEKRLEVIGQRMQYQGPSVRERSTRGHGNAAVQTQDPDTPEILAKQSIEKWIEQAGDRKEDAKAIVNAALAACNGSNEGALSLIRMALKDGNREACKLLGIRTT